MPPITLQTSMRIRHDDVTARKNITRPGVLVRMTACLLLPWILLPLAVLFPLALAMQGRPFLYCSERVTTGNRSFRLFKIRTMRPCVQLGESVLGGHQSNRVTPLGKILRRYRMDELPQIFNVIRGDIGFIGPRPPLKKYVEEHPELYARVLRTPPGITGLATVSFHRHEQLLLARCNTVAETEAVYRRRCIPTKARLDFIYQNNRSLRLDALIVWRTFSKLLLPLSDRKCGAKPGKSTGAGEFSPSKPPQRGGQPERNRSTAALAVESRCAQPSQSSNRARLAGGLK